MNIENNMRDNINVGNRAYVGEFICGNCNWSGELEVTKGTTRVDFATRKKCPYCETISLVLSSK